MTAILGSIPAIITWTLIGSYGLSGLITFINHASSNSRIRRKGNEIKPITTNSLFENFKYLIKDFGYMILPIYNLIKSVKEMIMKDADFDNNKISRLKDRDRLVEIKKPEEKKEEVKEEETKETKKQPQQNVTELPQRRLNRPEMPQRRQKTVEEMTCTERKQYYENEYNRIVALRTKAKAAGASVSRLNEYTAILNDIVSEYQKADRECKLESLRTERNIILSEPVDSKRLIKDKCVY